ncbi:MAG: DNA gyrase inhibitor YacG [Rhodocyclaceae bacterium]|nr:MAG: DNA gyrase inhibitor YacG [Rhodocyclaceae bacterium]
MPTTVRCPTCGKAVQWLPESVWRPFCSERCKKIDLGAWANEEYPVPVVDEPEDPESAPPSMQ